MKPIFWPFGDIFQRNISTKSAYKNRVLEDYMQKAITLYQKIVFFQIPQSYDQMEDFGPKIK